MLVDSILDWLRRLFSVREWNFCWCGFFLFFIFFLFSYFRFLSIPRPPCFSIPTLVFLSLILVFFKTVLVFFVYVLNYTGSLTPVFHCKTRSICIMVTLYARSTMFPCICMSKTSRLWSSLVRDVCSVNMLDVISSVVALGGGQSQWSVNRRTYQRNAFRDEVKHAWW